MSQMTAVQDTAVLGGDVLDPAIWTYLQGKTARLLLKTGRGIHWLPRPRFVLVVILPIRSRLLSKFCQKTVRADRIDA